MLATMSHTTMPSVHDPTAGNDPQYDGWEPQAPSEGHNHYNPDYSHQPCEEDYLAGATVKDYFVGTPGIGTPEDECLVPAHANDYLVAGPEEDYLVGDSEKDYLVGAPEKDFLVSTPDTDYLVAPDQDVLIAAPEGANDNDYPVSTLATDYIIAAPDKDHVVATPEEEYLIKAPGDDVRISALEDHLFKAPDNDFLVAAPDEENVVRAPVKDYLVGSPEKDCLATDPDIGVPEEESPVAAHDDDVRIPAPDEGYKAHTSKNSYGYVTSDNAYESQVLYDDDDGCEAQGPADNGHDRRHISIDEVSDDDYRPPPRRRLGRKVPFEDNEPPPLPHQPPDGGYGWVVAACAWLGLVLVSEIAVMFGFLYPHLLVTFQAGDVRTVAAMSCFWSCMFGVCWFAGNLCDTLGCRTVALLGNVVAAAGLLLAAMATNYISFFIGYGVLGGLGAGMFYMANVVIIQHYFTKKRSIAYGIANSGIGAGMFAVAPLTRWLIEQQGWRGTVLLLTGLWMNGMVTSSLFRTPKPSPAAPAAQPSTNTPQSPSMHSSLAPSVHSSLAQIPVVALHASSCELHRSRPLGPSPTSASGKPKSFCLYIRTAFTRLIDVKACCNVYVLIFTVKLILTSAFPMLQVYLPHKCAHDGLGTEEAATLIAVGGLADIVGRIVIGFVGYKVDAMILYTICVLGTGLGLIAIAFTSDFWTLVVVMVVAYICYSGYAIMMAMCVVDFLGVEYFARVFGLILLGHTVGFLSVGPFTSYLYTISNSYMVVFVTLGCLQLAGASLCVLILILRHMRCVPIPPPPQDDEAVLAPVIVLEEEAGNGETV